jgi:glycosyltransferase involved in cell wall biosynthesis
MTEAEQKALDAAQSSWGRSYRQYRLIVDYANRLKATQCLLLYFDSCQLALVLGLPLPCSVSGIYFRPTFHYSRMAHATPSPREWLQQQREQIFLHRVLTHPKFKTLLCLDPFVVDEINQRFKAGKAVYLPDPVESAVASEAQVEMLRTRFEVKNDRKVMLLFGRLDDGRKGVAQLLDAVSTLPNEAAGKLCLMLIGFATPEAREQIEARVNQIRQAHPLQIISNYDYVPEEEVQAYFQLADIVLAPYQRHVGSSGILLQGAAAGKPVLCSNYGLIGDLTRRYQLGVTVDTTQPSEITKGIIRLTEAVPDEVCDRAKMQAFVAQSSPDNFAKIVFQTL